MAQHNYVRDSQKDLEAQHLLGKPTTVITK